jgi:hypothetical protein
MGVEDKAGSKEEDRQGPTEVAAHRAVEDPAVDDRERGWTKIPTTS